MVRYESTATAINSSVLQHLTNGFLYSTAVSSVSGDKFSSFSSSEKRALFTKVTLRQNSRIILTRQKPHKVIMKTFPTSLSLYQTILLNSTKALVVHRITTNP